MNLADLLVSHTRPSPLVERLPDGRIRCLSCAHRCSIAPGENGVCLVRFEQAGELHAPYGYVSGLHFDPIEKKPFYHAVPGASTLSFGMLGCNAHCGFCQNWQTSQTLRDPGARGSMEEISPLEIADLAVNDGASCVISTYNEPLITAEWAAAVFEEARSRGLLTGIVSNGFASPEVLQFLAPRLNLVKIDLKSFEERTYRMFGTRLGPVLDAIRAVHALGLWLEVVTLLIPGVNDSDEELDRMAGFLASVSCDIPWHISAFHPAYHMTEPPMTAVVDLRRAAAIGQAAGLRYVYAGNAPGQVGDLENTRCPGCQALLVKRGGYRIHSNDITAGGNCPQCRRAIPGVWRARVEPPLSSRAQP